MTTSPPARDTTPIPGTAAGGQRGRALVAGLVLLGLVAAVSAIVFQRQQTRRCLEFYGADHARRIAAAPVVELVIVEPGSGPGAVAARARRDISRAAGLVHLRRGLVEDANFAWDRGQDWGGAAAARPAGPADPAARLPSDAWDIAIEFSEPVGAGGEPAAIARRTQLVFDLDPNGGAVTVVGRPGRIGLGRIGPGLSKWIRGLEADAAHPPPR